MRPRGPTPREERDWKKWLSKRPKIVQELGERFPPWKLYRIKSTGHRAVLRSFGEDGTMTVTLSAEFNALLFERHVFGILPDDLEECDLPRPGEPLGALLTSDEVEINMDALRVLGRPGVG